MKHLKCRIEYVMISDPIKARITIDLFKKSRLELSPYEAREFIKMLKRSISDAEKK